MTIKAPVTAPYLKLKAILMKININLNDNKNYFHS